MIYQTFQIEDWNIELYIEPENINIQELLEVMQDFGCNYESVRLTYENIKKNKYNKGFTYSKLFQSLMFIGPTTSKEQLINTIAHESRHLQQHIANIYNMNQNGEQVCYLTGEIVSIIYKICKNYDLL